MKTKPSDSTPFALCFAEKLPTPSVTQVVGMSDQKSKDKKPKAVGMSQTPRGLTDTSTWDYMNDD